MKTEIKYLIIDTECLYDYWSFQYRNADMDDTTIIEITDDKGFYDFYHNVLAKAKLSWYDFAINYDKVMINALCKLVENEFTNINYHMRTINNHIIGNIKLNNGMDYFKINREFWCNYYFPRKDDFDNSNVLYEDSLEKIKTQYYWNSNITEFLNNYSCILGKSKVYNKLNIIDIPKLLFYYSIRNDGIIRPNISLKNLQLHEEQTNLKFDFHVYDTIDAIKKDNKYDLWLDYCKNDVNFLYRYFQKEVLPILNTRLTACKILQDMKNDFQIEDKMIHSENNTNLLIKAFSVNKSINETDLNIIEEIDYTKYIKPTNFVKFDNFVKFVNQNKHIKNDKKLKTLYCQELETDYINDDSTREFEGKFETIINSFDVISLGGTSTKFGFGGLHGAIDNYINDLDGVLYLDDYESLYPSIIRFFREYFKKIINMELYDALYVYRNTIVKPKSKNNKLSEEEQKHYQNLDKGCKLLLNSCYGLINSEFNICIANKTLGRLICLYGQYKCIQLADKILEVSPLSKLINVNTDGIIANNLSDNLIKMINDSLNTETFLLDYNKIDTLIQFDVNNYIKISNNHMKTKGTSFNLGIKQMFSRHEKLPCNTKNALKFIANKSNIEIEPILFHQKNKNESTITLNNETSSKDTIYYLTNKKNGEHAIKHIASPIILSLDGVIYYFTSDKKKADIKEYIKFARLTEEKIKNFTLNKQQNVIKYYPHVLIPETEQEKNKEKNSVKLKLGKLLNGDICLNGFKNTSNNILTIRNKPIQELSNYTMTEIRNSTECLGISIIPDNYTCVYTKDIEDIQKLDKYDTLKSTHKSGVVLYIFAKFEVNISTFNSVNIANSKYIPIHTFNKDYVCNMMIPKFIDRETTDNEN